MLKVSSVKALASPIMQKRIYDLIEWCNRWDSLCGVLIYYLLAIMQTVKLASLDGGVTSQTTAAGDSGAALPTESMRCPGPVAIAGIREGILWLIDAKGSPFMVPLSHPGIRARAAAAQGDAEAAAAIAESGEPQCQPSAAYRKTAFRKQACHVECSRASASFSGQFSAIRI